MAAHVTIAKIEDLADPNDRGWILIQNSDTKQREVYLRCPVCGALRAMTDHQISAAGVVHPSILCADCGYHVFGRLADWESAP